MTVATLSCTTVNPGPAFLTGRTWRCCASRSWQRCKVRSRASMAASATTADGNTGPVSHGLPLPSYRQHHTPLFLALAPCLPVLSSSSRSRMFEPTVTLPWWDWTSSLVAQGGGAAAMQRARADGRRPAGRRA